VALDDVAVQPSVKGHAAFEIDKIAWLPGIKVGLFEGFFYGGHAVGIGAYFFDGQTNAVMGNALIDFQFCREGRLDPEYPVGAGGFHGFYCAERFDDTGEHGVEIRKNWRRVYANTEKYRTFAFRKFI
jgi:hypothetical protein